MEDLGLEVGDEELEKKSAEEIGLKVEDEELVGLKVEDEVQQVKKIIEVPKEQMREAIQRMPKIEMQEVVRHEGFAQHVERIIEVPHVQVDEKSVLKVETKEHENIVEVPKV